MSDLGLLARTLVPLGLAVATALLFDRELSRRGLMPPGFASPLRRVSAGSLLAVVLWAASFAGLGLLGQDVPGPDLDALAPGDLFASHALLLVAVLAWYLIAFAGASDGPQHRFTAQLGLVSATPARDLGLGLALGVAVWLVVIPLLVAIGALLFSLGGGELLPDTPPALIPWLAAQPFWLKLAVALSAGVVEELFFRGFLQPRCGVLVSTVCFVLAHLAYDQPFMLVGITLLSLLFAAIVVWRQTIWPAILAHAFFDAVQLLVVIPLVLRYAPGGNLPVAQP